MPFHSEHIEHFQTLKRIRIPKASRVIGVMLVIGLAITAAILAFVPWVQTSAATGTVIALDPRDRVQNVTALVPGRIEQWFVTDGSMVRKGDPIARLSDVDPNLLARLQAERAQLDAEIGAMRQAIAVAQRDVSRMQSLYTEGLAPRRDYELAQIKVADYQAKVAAGEAQRNRLNIDISRQSAQVVRAPRDGRILQILGGDTATIVKSGDIIATFAPEKAVRVVELYVDGRDVPLIHPGRRVRLEFEGWPAIQFSGWPSVAVGMFDGRVRAIDVSASANGLFRVIVEPLPGGQAWPNDPFVRLGAKVQGWVLMDTVPAGFELWRLLNDFPLQYPAHLAGAPKAAPAKGEATQAETGAGNAGK